MISWVHNMPRVVVGRENQTWPFGCRLDGPQNCHRLGEARLRPEGVFRLLARQIPTPAPGSIAFQALRTLPRRAPVKGHVKPEVPGRRLAATANQNGRIPGSQETVPGSVRELFTPVQGFGPRCEFLCLPRLRQQGRARFAW